VNPERTVGSLVDQMDDDLWQGICLLEGELHGGEPVLNLRQRQASLTNQGP
jgi:hypothetical protein